MKIQTNLLLLAAVATIVITGSATAATVLLTDDFDTASGTGATFNNSLADDQSGSLATVSYSVSNTDFHIGRVDGAMVLNFQGAGFAGAWASLNRNFATDANNTNSPLEIQFDMWANSAAGNDGWVGFGIGSTQGGYFFDYPSYGFAATQGNGKHTYKLLISNTAGTGSAFNGVTNGASVEFFIDGVSQGTTTRTFATDGGYITFRTTAAWWGGGSAWGLGWVDNLSITAIPEPTSAALGLLGLGGLVMRRRRA